MYLEKLLYTSYYKIILVSSEYNIIQEKPNIPFYKWDTRFNILLEQLISLIFSLGLIQRKCENHVFIC